MGGVLPWIITWLRKFFFSGAEALAALDTLGPHDVMPKDVPDENDVASSIESESEMSVVEPVAPPIVSHPPTPELPDPPAPAVAPGPWCIRCERPMRLKSSMQCVACRAWFHVGCMRKDAADKCIFCK